MLSNPRGNHRLRKKPPPKTYPYQENRRYFAQVADGLKEAAADELSELGADDVRPEFSGIYFKADPPALYRINYLSRLLSRCLAPLKSFDCPDDDILYQEVKKIQWEDFFSRGRTFAVSGNVSDSGISHSKYASLRVKDAVADYFREKTGQRPDVSPKNPNIQLNIHIRKDRAVLSLDTSGAALHKRGYREETVSAPMRETVAAAIIRYSGWDGSVPLYDPLCGSGTLLCEALMRQAHIPPGIFRSRFGFECLPDFNRDVWKQVKKEADGQIREAPAGLIAGSDVSSEAVRAARTNLMGLHHGNKVGVERADFLTLSPLKNHVITTNPPYGIRMGKDRNLGMFYKKFGDFLKQKCKGSVAFIYFGERKFIKNMGLKASWKKPIKAGGLDGRLVKYEMR
ncbi:RNA methyltransferase [Candidatus Desulfarcum epimagneticum]|uniref:RNA methyltransferase n=1 Tax=uncultured Desulfobacteraceae bacterium TaxID=218296 RepID=A0A484HJ84_9BACT|nr:RNA methyltransferase [uncultured Desulfobacteraceae bacterium]